MSTISLSQKTKRLRVQDFETNNPIVFNYFDNLPAAEREDKFLKAFYIGVLALMEDRIATFLSKTSNELGTELESLKLIFDMKQELFYRSSVKGIVAEEEVAAFLEQFILDHALPDNVELTGNTAGALPRNKTGDIVSYLGGGEEISIVIECKFDKSIRLGDIKTKEVFTRKTDTAWSQLIEAQANREGQSSIIVLDVSIVDSSVLKIIENVRFIPAVGFVAIIDSQKGDYGNLAIAYMLARDIAINSHPMELDKDLLAIIINRLIKDVGDTLRIKTLVLSNIDTNKKILEQLEKSMLLMEFNQRFLAHFLSTGTLTRAELLEFYSADDVKDRFKLVEKEIGEI